MNKLIPNWLSRWALIAALLAPINLPAQDIEDTDVAEQILEMQKFWDSLDPQTGDIQLGAGLLTLSVPDDYYFLNASDAKRVLVEIWGNHPDTSEGLGMLFPEKYTPFDAESWAVSLEYIDDGYVSDSDASEIDYDDLLRTMKKDMRASSKELVRQGYSSVELLGWAEPPHYDSVDKKLYWAKELSFDGSADTTLNYDIRALGRRGVLNMTFIAATSQLEEINSSRDEVLSMAQFNEGHRYSEFDPSIDKVAAYGIGALVAGKLAAKAGFFAIALVFLKKFGIFILLGIAAFGRKLLGVFGNKENNEPR